MVRSARMVIADVRRVALATLCMVCCVPAGYAMGQDAVARVTLMAGAPRMVGESIRPLQAILTGVQLETGAGDAVGLLVSDVVVHLGTDTVASIEDQPGRKVIQLTQGYVVLYTEPDSMTEVVVHTPFGLMTVGGSEASRGTAGRFSIRHDLAKPGISPAMSSFAAIEGVADVEGTDPVAGPYVLETQTRWRIVEGQLPGAPEDIDRRADEDADALRDMLHRRTAELVRDETIDIAELALEDLGRGRDWGTYDMVEPVGQMIVNIDPTIQKEIEETFQPELEAVFRFAQPVDIDAGDATHAIGQFVEVEGEPFTQDWNDYLTALNGMPAYQPTYLTGFLNGGFSYLQFAGPDAELATREGALFLASQSGAGAGWGIYTPELALGGADFDQAESLVRVVSDGFEAVATSAHLPGSGTLGGGSDPDSGFLVVSGDSVVVNPDLPSGYPQLDQASDTSGLEVDGVTPSEQVAAIGSGLNPLNPADAGAQIVFVSDSDTDAAGNSFNFDGVAISPTELDLPADRQIQEDATGVASLAAPIAADGQSTVGIQFAGSGEIIAIIHHAGSTSVAGGTTQVGDHFEVERGDTYTVIRWTADGRVVGSDGEVLELEDLNADPAMRNELFALIADEVNSVMPEGLRTVCGPAVLDVSTLTLRPIRRVAGKWMRDDDSAIRTHVRTYRSMRRVVESRAFRGRSLRDAGGRLLRDRETTSTRRHLGRVSTTGN